MTRVVRDTSPESEKPVVVLVGNYPLDRQESMLRFSDMLQTELAAAGYTIESISPRGVFGQLAKTGGLAKWLGYIDKYLLFPVLLARQLSAIKAKYAGRKIVVHICDHSNAVYVAVARKRFPVLITCHDLLAVRGALGEDTDCPASGFGRKLQAAILRGLGEATAIACVSRATQRDLVRLLGPGIESRTRHVPLALAYKYRALKRDEAIAILQRKGIDLPYQGYLLHVGSSLRRKNRDALPLSATQMNAPWPGLIVFAGEPLSAEERAVVVSCGLEDRVRELRPDNETLAALYCAAHCFVFMSRFEGFGWPILEAQMSECPVICSTRTSVPEVAGDGALICEPDDYSGIARDIQRLHDPVFRDSLIALGLKNAQSYTTERLTSAYEQIYREI